MGNRSYCNPVAQNGTPDGTEGSSTFPRECSRIKDEVPWPGARQNEDCVCTGLLNYFEDAGWRADD